MRTTAGAAHARQHNRKANTKVGGGSIEGGAAKPREGNHTAPQPLPSDLDSRTLPDWEDDFSWADASAFEGVAERSEAMKDVFFGIFEICGDGEEDGGWWVEELEARRDCY